MSLPTIPTVAIAVVGLLATACGSDSPQAVDEPSPPVTAATEESAGSSDTAAGPVGPDAQPTSSAETTAPAPSPTRDDADEPTDADQSVDADGAADEGAGGDAGAGGEDPAEAEPPPPEPARDPVTHAADVVDFGYEPADLSIGVGDTVTWTNVGDVNHTVTFSGGADSGSMSTGDTFSQTFDSTGTFGYRCLFHSQMQGTVTVG